MVEQRQPYKYENVANVGDRIRSYDFMGRQDCYIEGRVIRKDTEGNEQGFAAFVVVVDVDGWPHREGKSVIKDGQEIVVLEDHIAARRTGTHPAAVIRSTNGGRFGTTTYVPMEVAFEEYDGRIINLGRLQMKHP